MFARALAKPRDKRYSVITMNATEHSMTTPTTSTETRLTVLIGIPDDFEKATENHAKSRKAGTTPKTCDALMAIKACLNGGGKVVVTKGNDQMVFGRRHSDMFCVSALHRDLMLIGGKRYGAVCLWDGSAVLPSAQINLYPANA